MPISSYGVTLASALATMSACRTEPPVLGNAAEPGTSTRPQDAGTHSALTTQAGESDEARVRMVDDQLVARGIRDPRVLSAMRSVPRHRFVPAGMVPLAYDDSPLPIGLDQTISQPYIVALMSELAELEPSHKVLEIGTGSGYQAAVLAALAKSVYSIEILEPLAQRAQRTLAQLEIKNVHVRAGDGYLGWPEHAPFDAILVTAAPPEVPRPLKEQLALGGRLVIPVGTSDQELRVLTKTAQGFSERTVLPVRFVPMTGKAQQRE